MHRLIDIPMTDEQLLQSIAESIKLDNKVRVEGKADDKQIGQNGINKSSSIVLGELLNINDISRHTNFYGTALCLISRQIFRK